VDLDSIRTEWGMKRGSSQWWDEVSGDFSKRPIPDKENDRFMSLLDRTYEGENGSAIDIGCGTGQFSIALSDTFTHVSGVDISPNMIEAAKRLAAEHGRTVDFRIGDWSYLPSDSPLLSRRYDLEIAHLTPAIDSVESLEKMVSVSDGMCYVMKHTSKKDPIGDEVSKIIGKDLGWPKNVAPYMFSALWMMGYKPRLEYWTEVWSSKRSVESVEKNYLRGTSIEDRVRQELRDFLQSISEGGMIDQRTDVQMTCMYWNNERF